MELLAPNAIIYFIQTEKITRDDSMRRRKYEDVIGKMDDGIASILTRVIKEKKWLLKRKMDLTHKKCSLSRRWNEKIILSASFAKGQAEGSYSLLSRAGKRG